LQSKAVDVLLFTLGSAVGIVRMREIVCGVQKINKGTSEDKQKDMR
jgi:hypothetical protein